MSNGGLCSLYMTVCVCPCACVCLCACVHVCMCVSVCVYGAFQWVTLNTHWLKSAWSCSSPLPLSSFLSPLVLHSHSSFSIYCFFMLIHSLSPHSVSLSLPTLLIFKVLWFVSLQTLMSSRGKISARITSKHQHHLPSSSRSLLPPVLPAFTVLLHLKSCPLFIVCFSNTWFSLYSRFSHLFFNFLLFCASISLSLSPSFQTFSFLLHLLSKFYLANVVEYKTWSSLLFLDTPPSFFFLSVSHSLPTFNKKAMSARRLACATA